MAQKICELPLTPIQESTQWLYAKKKNTQSATGND